MIRSGVAERYAKAVFQAAVEAGAADQVFADMENIFTLLPADVSFRNFLASPRVPTEDKHALLDKAFAGRASKLVVELLHVLIDKKRIMHAAEIAEAYRYLYERHKGILEVKAVTAVTLEDRLKEKLLRTLETQTKKEIRITYVIDPDILGGMILKLEDRVIDGSVRYELDQLRRRLEEAKVVRAEEAPGEAGA